MIEVSCACGKSYKIPEAQLGKKGKCSHCGKEFKLTESGRWKTNSGRLVDVRKKSKIAEILGRNRKAEKRKPERSEHSQLRVGDPAGPRPQPFAALAAKPDFGPKVSNREKWAGWNSGADFQTVRHVTPWKMRVLQVSWSFILLGPICLVSSGIGAELFGLPLLLLGLIGVVTGKVLTTLWTPGRRWMRNSLIVAGVLLSVGTCDNVMTRRRLQRQQQWELEYKYPWLAHPPR